MFLARLSSEPVEAAYLNPVSINIDYGVHVRRSYWRKRIGTRLLSEILGYARSTGRRVVSVVRVLRSRRSTATDRRAIGFYGVNNPLHRLNVYRATPEYF